MNKKSTIKRTLGKNKVFCINCKRLLVLNKMEENGETDISCPVCGEIFSLQSANDFIEKISNIQRGSCPHCNTDLIFDLEDRLPGNEISCPRCKKIFFIENSISSKVSENNQSVEKKDAIIVQERSIKRSLQIPEPTRSLLWITDEDPSLAESPMSINIDITIGNNGVSSKIREKGFNAEPSLIWTKLPVKENNDLETEAMYWPRYVAFDPEHRYQYLNWLRDITKPTNLSYVFLYFYGLERHLLIGDYDSAVDEIIKLMNHHKKGSFINYATTSLIVASIRKNRVDIVERVPSILEQEVDEALALRIMLGTPITAEDVISMASRVGFTNRRYIKLYPELFEKTLNEEIEKFEKEFGPILKVFDINSFRRASRSVFANMSIPEEYRIVKVPQIIQNTKFKNAMFNLLQNVHDKIKGDLKEKRKVKK